MENAPAISPATPGQDDRAVRAAAAADPRDQRGVGHEPVHRAEDGRAQPSAADVPVLAQVPVGGVGRLLPRAAGRAGCRTAARRGVAARRSPAVTRPGWRCPAARAPGQFQARTPRSGWCRRTVVACACRHLVLAPVLTRCHAARRSRSPAALAVPRPAAPRPAVPRGAGAGPVRARVPAGRPCARVRAPLAGPVPGWRGGSDGFAAQRDVRPAGPGVAWLSPDTRSWSATGAPSGDRGPSARRCHTLSGWPVPKCWPPCHAAPRPG